MAYKIQRGDTLSGIAKANNTTVSALMAANPQISNANKIYAGDSLNIPGSSGGGSSGSSSSSGSSGGSSGSSWSGGSYGSGGSSGSSRSSGGSYSGGSVPYSGHTTYGQGEYGGKYLGSNKTSAYQNMENAPGSTGYEKGTLTLRVQKKDDEGNVYYEDETREGVLPLGTSFRATGSALADAQGVPDSSGIFAYAKGRTPGYIEHASGYTGYGYQDAKGNFYDANGNYLREDNFYYEPGAQISKNGMYQDTGNGMSHAGYGVWGTPGKYIAVQGATYGKAPGTYMGTFGGGGSYEAPAASTPVTSAPAATPSTPVQTPTVEEVRQALGNTYMNDMAQYNNTANVVPSTYQDLLKELDEARRQGRW